MSSSRRPLFSLATVCLAAAACVATPPRTSGATAATTYDLAVLHGRVMDPESGVDAFGNVGVLNGRVAVITTAPITARIVLDATGHVVAPGFIDLHQHAHEPVALHAKARDGVTAAFEMELGTRDVDEWYGLMAGQSPIHYGAAIGHGTVRAEVLTGSAPLVDVPTGEGAQRAATAEEIARIREKLRHGLQRGALGIGLALGYTPGTTAWEMLEVFRTAAEFPGAPVHVHVRDTEPPQHWLETAELFLGAIVSGAPLQIVHANSSYGGDALRLFEMIEAARARGLDVTTEAYPYTTAMTHIDSAPFDAWESWSDDRFARFVWPPTGERLTRETFGEYRAQGGLVIIEGNTEEKLRPVLASPLTMIVSDGGMVAGVSHPRMAGSFARVLGKYVREERLLTLMDALRKMTLMPAQRLEARAPAMRTKGRLRVGADADITVFDPAAVLDRATFREPLLPSAGIRHVVVAGVPVVRDGVLDESAAPGTPIRAQ